jgi:hypothetical protein
MISYTTPVSIYSKGSKSAHTHTHTHTHTQTLFSYKEGWNHVIDRKMDETGDHHVKQSKPDSEWQVACFSSYVEPRGENMALPGKRKRIGEVIKGISKGIRAGKYGWSVVYACMEIMKHIIWYHWYMLIKMLL